MNGRLLLMEYSIKAIPTKYNGVNFRSRLEARWAAFFDLVNWKWQYEPLDLDGWIPDFLVEFPCSHSECYGSHKLFVEIKPIEGNSKYLENYAKQHPMNKYFDKWKEPNGALFGLNPDNTIWTMCHGSGGGYFEVSTFIRWDYYWIEAGNIIQWKPKNAA